MLIAQLIFTRPLAQVVWLMMLIVSPTGLQTNPLITYIMVIPIVNANTVIACQTLHGCNLYSVIIQMP